MDQITSLLSKIEQLEVTHKTQVDELKTKSLTESKLSQVKFEIIGHIIKSPPQVLTFVHLKKFSQKILVNFGIYYYLRKELKYNQDKLTESQAEVSSLRDENAHQSGRCSSIQQRLREAETRINGQNDELNVSYNFDQVKLLKILRT